ncbi:hypothetical protein HYALB_00001271 [Hymenoscyphus albidus]|uniref:Ubiquinol-cytochrome-c reductase complex assembly factor 2 n=1 Tax=Hymenoscyphus albidus TaxID=595503 RepID=A0A9N9LHI6_9HELO|nr:hypothetical protein HYALB_00001271 [Hymenoscyphus albidus]
MSRAAIYKHYMRALSQWPKDALRPECRFEDVMQKRIEQKFNPPKALEGAKPAATTPKNEEAEMNQVHALFSLIGNQYTRKFPLGPIMKPASNPTHYTDLVEELSAAPNRSLFERLVAKWRKSVRLQ